jgi:ketopantoate reductase
LPWHSRGRARCGPGGHRHGNARQSRCAFTSSLHHDLAEGRRLELEALHWHAVRLGERRGIPTPMLFGVYAVLKPYADGLPQAARA